MSLHAVGQHLYQTVKTIKGALNPLVWQSLSAFYAAHKQEDFEGPIAEIGVHHGKFFISLLNIASTRTPSYAFDLFDMQDSNVDLSGRGDLSIFQENIVSSGFRLDNVRCVRGDSLLMSPADCTDIVRAGDKFSFFSVDGGHTTEHTIGDLRLAMLMTSPNGIIMLDDYYNPNWPGVQEGAVRLYTLDTPSFVPILYSGNKLFLCHISKHEKYLQFVAAYLRQKFPKSRVKKVRRLGYEGLTVLPDGSEPDPRNWFPDAD